MLYNFLKGSLIILGFFGLFQSEANKWDNKIAHSLNKFSESEARKQHLEYIGHASGSHVEAKDAKWALSFVDRHATEINLGRQKIVKIIDDFWSELQSNDIFREYFKWRYYDRDLKPPNPYYSDSYLTLNPNSMGIRLAYWDENTDRRTYPYLAQIRVADSKIYYYYANTKSQELGKPIVETFEEARQKTKEYQTRVQVNPGL